MLSRSRSGFLPHVALLVLGVSACAGSSDINTPAGTGGNQTGTAGTPGGGGTTGNAGTSGAAAAATGGSPGRPGAGGSTATGGAGGGTTGSAGTTGGGSGRRDRNGRQQRRRRGTRWDDRHRGTGRHDGHRAAPAAPRAGGGATAGTTGNAGTTGSAGTTGAGGGLIWPNDQSSANSDDWLVQNHDEISQLRPQRAGDRHRQHVERDDADPAPHRRPRERDQLPQVQQHERAAHGRLPAGEGREGNVGPSYTDLELAGVRRLEHPDQGSQGSERPEPDALPAVREGRHQRGLVHGDAEPDEVRRDAGDEGRLHERRPAREDVAAEARRTRRTATTSRGLDCKVSIAHHRLQHVARRRLPPARDGPRLGALHGRAGVPAPAQAGGALPQLGSQHARVRAVQQLLQRVQQQRLAAHRLHRLGFADRGPYRAVSAAKTFNIADMSGGCGNAHFYANTTGTYSYDANTPDPMVLSSCEHYGLHDGTGGKDMTTPYTNKMTDDLATAQQAGPCTAGSPYCSTERRLRRPRHVVPVPELPGLRHHREERRRHPHAQLVGVFVLLGGRRSALARVPRTPPSLRGWRATLRSRRCRRLVLALHALVRVRCVRRRRRRRRVARR